MCFPNISPLFGDSSSQSSITAAGWPGIYDFDSGLYAYPGIYKGSDGYHITDYTGLQAMSDFSNAYDDSECFKDEIFYLDNDIDCTDLTDFKAIKYFNGTFNGNNHAIINLSCIDNAPDYQGIDCGDDEYYNDYAGQGMACFIWHTEWGMTIGNTKFLNLRLEGRDIFSPTALIGGNVSEDGVRGGVSIGFLNVYVESYSTWGLGSGLVYDVNNMLLNIIFCSVIEKNPVIYEISSTPNVTCAAFAAITTYANITVLHSCAIGSYWKLFTENTKGATIFHSYILCFNFGDELYFPPYDPDDPLIVFDAMRMAYWDWTEDQYSSCWTYYDNLLSGLPFVNAPPSNILGNLWITPNSSATNAEALNRLEELGFNLTTAMW